MSTQISDPQVTVNNIVVGIVPNSVMYKEGFGEQDVLVQSAGNGNTSTVYSNNVETNLGSFKFDMRATVENIALVRSWKANGDRNAVTITGNTPDGNLTRTFNNAALTSDYEVALSADGVLSLEWKSQKPTQ